jgi:hypothetical protein
MKSMGRVDGDRPLGGEGGPVVEVDKTFLGGHDKMGWGDKHIVLGMIERGGHVLTRPVATRLAQHVVPEIRDWVEPNSRVMSDSARVFDMLREDFEHSSVDHSKKEWVRGDIHTNTIEAFWNVLKRGINGTYVWVSAKHLQKYLWEFEYRHNLRKEPWAMFQTLMFSFSKASR